MVPHARLRGRTWSSVFLGLIIALLVAPLAVAAPDAVLIVDDFSTNQARLTATLGSPATSVVSGGGILGMERDLRTTVTSDLIGGRNATSEVTSHSITHSQESGVVGDTLIQWDGVDGGIALNATGLGGVDLTQGNTQNGLQIEVILNDLPIDLIFTVYTDAGNSSTRTVSLPGGQPTGAGSKYYYVEYASFTVATGAGADFANVGAVELLFDGLNDATDLTIHDIRTAAFDWGDLPEAAQGPYTYPTRFVNNGPRHLIGSLSMGGVIDSTEINGVPTVGANGDDVNPAVNDENGVARTPAVNWQSGANGGSIDVTVTGGNGCFAGWIDWNQDGDLNDSGENIFNGQPLAAGNHTLTFSIPVNPFNQSYYARFRLFAPETDGSCLTNYTTTGRAINGEVEDYVWGFGPNAVSLAAFGATSVGLPWAVGLVLPASLALYGATRIIRRRTR